MRDAVERLRRRLGALLHRRALERDMDDEMRLHLEMEAAELVREGVAPAEAWRRARMAFGGVERFKEEARDGRGTRWLEDLVRDVRLAARQLRAAPGFALISIVTLALGISATTIVFSFTNAALLRPLPLPEPERVVGISRMWDTGGRDRISAAAFFDLADRTSSFAALGAYYSSAPFNLSAHGGAEYLDGGIATPEVLGVYGARAMLGRLFTADDEERRVVVLGHGVWKRHFGADSTIVGRTVELNGGRRTVIGVLAEEAGPEEAQLWIPLRRTPELTAERRGASMTVVGRLRPGVSPERADAEVRAIGARLAVEHPDSDGRSTLAVHALRDHFVGTGGLRSVLLLLLGAVGFVLLIACANVASLQLARTAARRREILLRASLGASRGRLMRQLLTESVLLALAGGAAGLLLAHAGLRLLRAAVPIELPSWLALDLDWRVLVFTAAVTMLTAMIFGLTPALGAGRVRVAEALRAGPRAGGSRDGTRLRSTLVVGQIALSLVLVVGATLLVQSFVRLQGSRLGFDPAGAVVMRLSLAGPRYEAAEQRAAFYTTVLERVGALPGVRSASIVTGLAVARDSWNLPVEVEGVPVSVSSPNVLYTAVMGDYFGAMGVELAAGRVPEGAEATAAEASVAVVNEAMARTFWPDGPAIGRRFRIMGNNTGTATWYTVVGIARDAVQRELGQPARPQAFVTGTPGHTTRLVVRASSDRAAAALVPLVRASLAGVDPSVPAFDALLLRDVLAQNESYWVPRLWSGLFGTFAAVALAIAAVGLFGVISYVVRQRSHELGVRLALGATPRDVLRLVLGRGARLAVAGIVLGVLGAAATTRLLAGLLYGVEAGDVATFVAVPVLILAVALLASWLPARRAMRADPVAALRTE